MRVFADTSGLFAALVRNDHMHVRAKAVLAHLIGARSELHVTSYVLLETESLLQARVGLDAARQFDHVYRPLLRIHWVDEPMHDRAFRRLELRESRSVSLVDCSSFVVMEAEGLRMVFGYDPHFAEEGFRVIGHTGDLQDPSRPA
jgi:predicted nucleic acid-binding protein